MKLATILILAALPLAGCVTGHPEYAALPDTGPLTDTRLTMARATCQLGYNQQVNTDLNAGAIPDVKGLVDNMKLCFLTQGIQLTGWRKPNGRLDPSPFTH
jgi:hypothetical protein